MQRLSKRVIAKGTSDDVAQRLERLRISDHLSETVLNWLELLRREHTPKRTIQVQNRGADRGPQAGSPPGVVVATG
jgi:hypothetical protein